MIWLTLSIVAYGLTFSFDDPLVTYRYGAASWPRTIILAIAIFALIDATFSFLAFRRNAPKKTTVMEGGKNQEKDEETEKKASGAKVNLKRLTTFAFPLVFLLMIPRMGYYVSAPFFIAGFMFLLGEKRTYHLVVTTFLIYAVTLFVFTKLLFVPLPEGIWPGFYEISSWILRLLT
jgi:hypothetical protein